MESYSTNFYGIDLEVHGTYEEPEEETGYKGGFSCHKLYHCNEDITDLLSESIIIQIEEQIVSEI